MAWIESHQELGRHPKLKRFARELGVSRVTAVGHLHYLWWWALDYADDGDLSACDPADIAEEAMWDGDPDTFIRALVSAGFLSADNHIHDWGHYTGRIQAQREANRERQRRFRDRHTGEALPTETPNRDVTVTSRLDNAATVPNRTVPDQTVPDHGGVPPVGPPPSAAPPEPAIPRPVPKARPTRVPETFAVTDRLAEFAAAKGLSPPEIAVEAERFRDYYQATGKTMVDWAAAWRNWVVRSVEFRSRSPTTNGNGSKPYGKDIGYTTEQLVAMARGKQ